MIPNQQDINDLYALVIHIEDSYQTTKKLIFSSKSTHQQEMLQNVEEKFNSYLSVLKIFPQQLAQGKQLMMDCLTNIDLLTQHIDLLGQEENMLISTHFFHSISLVNQYLAGIHTIISPTKQILKFISDKEDNKIKAFMIKLGNVMSMISKAIEDELETRAFDDFIEHVLPFNDIIDKINQVNQILEQSDFTVIDTIKSDMENLKKNYLQPPLQYQDEE